MTTTEASAPIFAKDERRGFLWDAYHRMRHNRTAMISLAIILLIILVAVFADLIAPDDPSEQFLKASTADPDNPLAARDTGKFEGPSWRHLFGTDQLARDIFSRTVFGLRISLGAAFFAVIVVITLGMLVGTLAATGPRVIDDVLMRLTDVTYAFPDLLLIILMRAAFGDSIFGVDSIVGIDMSVLLLFFAISIVAWPTTARLVRGQLLSIREKDYAVAARSIGASPLRVAFRHMLPNALSPVIVEATFLVPRAILAEATLSFIGFGVPPPAPSLGRLINDHFGFVLLQWPALAIPCAILAILFIAFQFFGDGLRDALDPRSARLA